MSVHPVKWGLAVARLLEETSNKWGVTDAELLFWSMVEAWKADEKAFAASLDHMGFAISQWKDRPKAPAVQ